MSYESRGTGGRLTVDDSVFTSTRWTSETQVRDGIEWRMDYRDGELVQVLLRPEGDTQWRRPIEYLEVRMETT